MTTSIDAEQQQALDIARGLVQLGIPLFIAERDPAGIGTGKCGFWLPTGWEQTTPDPAVVDRWRPGMALCAVMGCGIDLIDIDTRNGGDPAAMNGSTPRSYGVALTPSGGAHSFIVSTGAGSRDGVFPGIDVKSGMPDGSGRGFAFLAPTVRISKVTGEPAPYRWGRPPDLEALAAVLRGESVDSSGTALAAKIRELKAGGGITKPSGPDWYREFMSAREPQSAPAAERAIREKLEEITACTPTSGGGFRRVLLRAALTLGGYVGGGYLDEADARDKLIAAVVEVWGAPDDNDLLWIDQGITDGQEQPFAVYTAEDELAFSQAQTQAQRSGGEPPWNIFTAIGNHPFDPVHAGSDQELAEAVAERMHPALRYGVDSGTWLVRGPKVWTEREDMSAWAVSMVARLMPMGQTPVPKEVSERTEMHWQAVRRAKFLDSGGSSRVERKLRAIARNADHPAGIELAELDIDPEVLWAGGLPYDLRESRLEPVLADVDPATPHLRTALCTPVKVPTPHWNRFVATVWPNEALRAWALRVLSISLAGYPDAALPVLYGPERTGKSSLIQLIVEVLGSYAHAADPRLLGGADNTHASVVYALKGRRLSFIDEGPRRGHLASERLKQLTGGTSLTGNAMRANPITFRPTHTLVMTTNDEPPVTDPALRARLRIIPCEADQAGVRAARRAITPAVWRVEAPGVLAALMAECAAWLADQDSAATAAAPLAVRASVEEMVADQDSIQEWVETCTVHWSEGTPLADLFKMYAAWHDLQLPLRRVPLPTKIGFARTLSRLGYENFYGGPRGKTRMRALTVMGSAGGPLPTPPTGQASAATLPQVAADQTITSAAPQNPSSDPVFSMFAADAADKYRSIDPNIQNTPKRSNVKNEQTNTGDTSAAPSGPPPKTGVLPATMGCRTSGAADVGQVDLAPSGSSNSDGTLVDLRGSESGPAKTSAKTPSDLHKQPSDVVDHAELGPSSTESDETGGLFPAPVPEPKKITNTDVAARAYQGGPEKKITKVEARAQLKAEERQAAIQAASGEVYALPVVVDRAQNVLPVNLEQAAAVVRSGMAATGALTVDVETSGYPVGHEHHWLRSVQLGTASAAVVLDPVTHAELIRELLGEAPKLHAHSASADLVPLAHAGLIDAEAGWAKMHDTVIPAKLADPRSTGSDPGLKQLSEAVLGASSVAPAADAGRDALWKAARWQTGKQRFLGQLLTPLERNGWAQVETGCTTMLRYAASDVLDTAALAQALPVVPEPILGRERLAEAMTARVAHRGLRIDEARLRELTAEHTRLQAEAGVQVRVFGVENPGSGPQIAAALQALGEALPISEKGNASVAEHVLSVIKRSRPDTPAGQLAAAVLNYRHSTTVLGLFLAPYTALCERADGRMRPTVYTLGTDTGRMSAVRPNCFDSATEILTDHGWVPFPEVTTKHQVAQWHVDGSIDFTLPNAVIHQSYDGPMVKIQTGVDRPGGGTEQVVTPDHRVYSWTRRGRLAIDRASDWVHHGSDGKIVDRKMIRGGRLKGRILSAEERRTLALAVAVQADGWLRDDCRRIHIGAHKQRKADRLVELGVAVQWRPGLDYARFDAWVDPVDVEPWLDLLTKTFRLPVLLGLDADELDWLLAEVMRWDGDSTRGSTYGQHPDRVAAVDAVELVAALSGHSTSRYVKHVGGVDHRIVNVHRAPARWASRTFVTEAPSDGWIHCVTMPSGAVVTRRSGRITISGNCQQLPRAGGVRSVVTADPGHVLISADFSGVELRGAAALSQDPTMMHMIAEEDAGRFDGFHWAVARQAFGPDATKEDRYVAKRGVFGKIYGGGVATLAKQVGVTEHEMGAIVASLDALTPGLSQWSETIRRAVRQGHTQFPSYSGRVIHFPRDYPHKSPNYAIQGSCRELLVDALVRWRDTKWGDATLIPVHDELIVMVPEADADEATRILVQCMEGELHGVKIVAEPSEPSYAWADSS